MELNFIPVKTRVVRPPKDEIWDILDGLEIKDGDIIFITSKILAIHQGRCVRIENADKKELIEKEATHLLPFKNFQGFNINLTINENVLIPGAGIDESNADGHYILWPKGIDELCKQIRTRLTKKHNIKNLGIVSTDSNITPLRWGVTGIAIGLSGIIPLKDLKAARDIFNRPIHITQVNLVDPLAAIAVLLMGETDEQTPIVILRDYSGIPFCESGNMDIFKIEPEKDLFQPFIELMEKNNRSKF